MDQEWSQLLARPNPGISVIVPLYNKAQFLAEAVASVAAQNYPDLEIIIRDDGSTDGSAAVMHSLPAHYPGLDIKTIGGENLGASACRNILIERTRNRLIMLMDADDIMLHGFLSEAVQAMRLHNARVVYSDVELFGFKDGEWCPQPFDRYTIRYDNCLTSLALMDKRIWAEIGGYDPGLPFNEDWSFFIRAAEHTDRFYKIPKKYFRYRQTESGLYHSFIQDRWAFNLALVMLATPNLYAVEEVMRSVETLRNMPLHWAPKYEECARKHPSSSLAWLVLSIASLAVNDAPAFHERIAKALNTCGPQDWVALLLAGEFLQQSSPAEALSFMHLARTRRPDVGRLVNEKIRALSERILKDRRPGAPA